MLRHDIVQDQSLLALVDVEITRPPLHPCLNHHLTYDPFHRPRPAEAPLITQICSFHMACLLPNVKQPRSRIRGIHLARKARMTGESMTTWPHPLESADISRRMKDFWPSPPLMDLSISLAREVQEKDQS